MKKDTAIVIVIVIAIVALAGFLFVLTQFSANNTSNATNNSSTLNNMVLNDNTSNNAQNQTNNPPPPPTDISADKAKDLAQKYVGPGTTLGKPALTTYKRVKAWQIPVYTLNHKFINNIYIDARTGEKVD